MKAVDMKNAMVYPLTHRRAKIIYEIYGQIMAYLDEHHTYNQDPPIEENHLMQYLGGLENSVSVAVEATSDEDYDRKLIDSVISRLKEDGFKISVDFYENKYILNVSWPSI